MKRPYLPLTFTIGLLALILASIGYWLYNARHGDSPEWEQVETRVIDEPEVIDAKL